MKLNRVGAEAVLHVLGQDPFELFQSLAFGVFFGISNRYADFFSYLGLLSGQGFSLPVSTRHG
jgi:uncharacterized membrane protein YccC